MSTGISYHDETWNPTTGCLPGLPCWCRCWARGMTARFHGGAFAPTFHADRLAKPRHWKKPRHIGVSFMGDLFADGITDEQIAAVFGVMAACPRHTFVVLTKRAARMAAWFQQRQCEIDAGGLCLEATARFGALAPLHPRDFGPDWPLPNVWLGVSISTQADADARIPHLLRCPAKVRWVSVEPMIGPVRLNLFSMGPDYMLTHELLSWVVCGAESGAGARPMDIAWARHLREQCSEADVAFYYKQGPGDPGKPFALPRLDGVQHVAFPVVP
jgi:protein gp37